MIAVIVGSMFFVLTVIAFVTAFKDRGDIAAASVGILTFIAMAIVIILPLSIGKSIYKQDNRRILREKESIEYILETQPSYYIIKEAETYNSNIELGNNYFCRFSIEDRSEFKIDIDKYLKGDK